MQNVPSILKDGYYRTGLYLIALSTTFFCFPYFFKTVGEGSLAFFFMNFSFTAGYFFYLWGNRRNSNEENWISYRYLLQVLMLVSAYSLNREMNVFEDSVNWLSAALIISSLNYIAYPIVKNATTWVQQVSAVVAGLSFALFLYMSFYLFPMYALGILGVLLIGVSLHVFVPAFIAFNTVIGMNKLSASNSKIWIGFVSGVALALITVGTYCVKWNSINKDITASQLNNSGKLPTWVAVAKTMPANDMAMKMIKTDLVYTSPSTFDGNFFWRMPQMNFDEKKKHDPFVMIASFFSGVPNISREDRISIIKANFNGRHQAEERLWSGSDLVTTQVETKVKLWPVCNIGYTEKIIQVANTELARGWNRQQEAIYTFNMPEGAVVTSLSLWINGEEEKSILTTKHKADTAYKAIVGVERRDPSVVHWQEGNRVSLRVFPVLASESRKFKLGITAPLSREDGKLVYQNISFDGPDNSHAKETIQIDFEQPVKDFKMPVSLVAKSSQSYSSSGNYNPTWSLNIADNGLAGCDFSFDGDTYSLSPYHKKIEPVTISDIYLDVNKNWSKSEVSDIISKAGGRNVYVYTDELRKITNTDFEKTFSELRKNQFSLFPLFEISNPTSALLITKGTENSCSLTDLAEMPFMSKTKKFLSKGEKIKVFSLGSKLSPYLKSLKEYRAFQYDNGDMAMLERILSENIFAADIENDNQVVIHQAEMLIEKKKANVASSGPDHLMRLFAYNHIMQKAGAGLVIDRPIDDTLVQEASKAHIVTPLSSMIVLETQADYRRFGIEDSNNSLKNATMNSKGAVPEPHEWALIIIGIAALIYTRFYSRIKLNKA